MKKIWIIITSVILLGIICGTLVFAANITDSSQATEDILPNSYSTEHQTGKYWMDGSPIYEKYFAYKIYEDSWAGLDKELLLDEIFGVPLNDVSIISASAQAAHCPTTSNPSMLNTCNVDTINLSYDGSRFIILEDTWFPDTQCITLWGTITYIKKGEMPESIFIPYLSGHVSE